MNESRLLSRQLKPGFLESKNLARNSSSLKGSESDSRQAIEELEKVIRDLEYQLAVERVRNEQLLSLNEFGHKLESISELPIEAQLATATLQTTLRCSLACILIHAPIEQRLVLLASSGPDAHLLPPNFRHSLTHGLVGRAIRAHKILMNQESVDLPAPLELAAHTFASEMVVPLYYNGFLEGIILLADSEASAFDPVDLPFVEALSARLLAAWDNDRYRHTLAELVQSAANLSTSLNPGQLLGRIAEIARKSTKALFTMVAVFDQHEWQTGVSGKAPSFFPIFEKSRDAFLDEILEAEGPIRLRDIRKDKRTAHLPSEEPEFRSLLASPFRLDNAPTGVILAFGKKSGVAFSEQDEFLVNLLSAHAAVSIERCFLDIELRSTLKTTQLLYDLSMRITESDDLTSASQIIALTAFRLFQAITCGIVLFSNDGRKEVAIQYPADDPTIQHPMEMIQQAMQSRQIVYFTNDTSTTTLAIPIQTQRGCYGALWLELPEYGQRNQRPVEEIRILINQAAVALERSILLSATRHQAKEIADAYKQLEHSYDQTLQGLMKALDARDNETEKHSMKVTQIALAIAEEMDLSTPELKALERGALMHDIGKIGIEDSILRKKGELNETEWESMRRHPAIGADIIHGIASLNDAIPVIANHHERWDGSGYPNHLAGRNIPLLARIFAVADVLDALTSNRSYRKKISQAEALKYIVSKAGILFDPDVVKVLMQVIDTNKHLLQIND
jgi:putative nucleotidyltransferase with HDIG domain